MKLFCFPTRNGLLPGYVTLCCGYSTVYRSPPEIQWDFFPGKGILGNLLVSSHNSQNLQGPKSFLAPQFSQFLMSQQKIIIKAFNFIIEILGFPESFRMSAAKSESSGCYAVACIGRHVLFLPFIYITYPILLSCRLMLD